MPDRPPRRRGSQTPFLNVQDGFLTTHTVEIVRLPEPEFMKEFVGKPEDKLHQPDGSRQPDDVRRRAEPGLLHEGQDRPTLVLRPGRAGAAGGVRRVLSQDRPPVRICRRLSLRRCRVHPGGMGCYMETAQTTVDYLRDEKGIKAGCLNIYCFRPFPAREIVDAFEELPGVHGDRANGRSAVHHRQPSDARDQGRLLRRDERAERHGADRPHSPIYLRRGRPGQPRRAPRRHSSPLFENMMR